MKRIFRQFSLLGLCASMGAFSALAQEIQIPVPDEEPPVEVYVPRAPTEEELRHYAMVAEAQQKWSALFSDPANPELHLDVAKHYNLLGNGDIALHELGRAEELGIPREQLFGDIARAYYLRGRYDDVLAEITIEQAPLDQHGEIYVVLGHIYFARNNLEQAFINYYQAAAYLAENRLELNAPLADLYSRMGEYELAEENVDAALEFAPKNPDLLMLKGDLVHRRTGAEHSYQYFEWANFYRPDDPKIQEKLAGALYNLGRDDEMVAVLRKMLARDQRNPFANFMIATNFAKGNNIRTASRYLNQVGRGYDNFPPALLLKGKLGYATGSYGQAQTALERLIRLEPDHANARRLLGAALLQQDKNIEAVRVLEYLVDHNLLEEADYLLLGNAYMLSGENDRASDYFYRANLVRPHQVSEQQRRDLDRYEIGDSFGVTLDFNGLLNKNSSINHRLVIDVFDALERRKYDDAFAAAVAVVEQDRRSPVGYNLLGLSYLGQQKVDEARSNFRRAIEIDEDFHGARLNLARLEFQFGRRNTAITILNQILARDEGYIPAYELLFENARENDDMIAAERYLLTASNANPDLLSARVRLMDFYLSENNLAKAVNWAQRMVQRFADHATPYKALGTAYLRSDQPLLARDNLLHSLTLEKRDEDIYLLLSEAYTALGEPELARPMLEDGLLYVKNKLPLQIDLIDLAKVDGNFANSQLYVNQLKLQEITKAQAFVFEGELLLAQNRAQDALSAFSSALKAGASGSRLDQGMANAQAGVDAAGSATANNTE